MKKQRNPQCQNRIQAIRSRILEIYSEMSLIESKKEEKEKLRKIKEIYGKELLGLQEELKEYVRSSLLKDESPMKPKKLRPVSIDESHNESLPKKIKMKKENDDELAISPRAEDFKSKELREIRPKYTHRITTVRARSSSSRCSSKERPFGSKSTSKEKQQLRSIVVRKMLKRIVPSSSFISY